MTPMVMSAIKSIAETMPRIEMASRHGSPFSNGIERHASETKVLLLCHIFKADEFNRTKQLNKTIYYQCHIRTWINQA
jgi:hypothetical protein